MAAVADRFGLDPERAWGGAVLALALTLLVGVLAFPRLVWDRFLWQYFWGPVQADANSAACAVRPAGGPEYLSDPGACASAAGPVAYPGYTVVSEVGYVVVLLLALVGVVFLLRRLDLGADDRLLFALLPFMLFGGAARVLEDIGDGPGVDLIVGYPWNTLIISPVIYFTVFAVTLLALLVAVGLARRGVVERYDRALLGVGLLVLGATLLYQLSLAWLPDTPVSLAPQVLAAVILLTAVATAGTWLAVERFAPYVNAGTGRMGLAMIGGHALDGAANVVALDWMPALGAGANLVPKHPVNRAIVDVTGAVLPESVLAVTGAAWPFLLVKLAAATLIVWVFDEAALEESPRFSILLLVAALAVGLGPGTRDALRATLGV